MTFRPSLLAAAVAVAAAGISASCASTPRRAGFGDSCRASEDCEPPHVCKAAVCAAARSPAGGVCVTAQGCEAGLACVSGRCATGLATREDCTRACDHVQELMSRGTGAGAPTDVLDRTSLLDFRVRCLEGCVGSASVERARCLEEAPDLETVDDCR